MDDVRRWTRHEDLALGHVTASASVAHPATAALDEGREAGARDLLGRGPLGDDQETFEPGRRFALAFARGCGRRHARGRRARVSFEAATRSATTAASTRAGAGCGSASSRSTRRRAWCVCVARRSSCRRRSSRSCVRWRPIRPGCSPRTSCCARSGAFARWAVTVARPDTPRTSRSHAGRRTHIAVCLPRVHPISRRASTRRRSRACGRIARIGRTDSVSFMPSSPAPRVCDARVSAAATVLTSLQRILRGGARAFGWHGATPGSLSP
jgi:hypothetical protein